MNDENLKIQIHESKKWLVTVEDDDLVYSGLYGTEPTREKVVEDYRNGRLTISSTNKEEVLERAKNFSI